MKTKMKRSDLYINSFGGSNLGIGSKRRDMVLDQLRGDADWCLEKTEVINDAVANHRLAQRGVRIMGTTRMTEVLSLRNWFNH